MLIGDFLLPCVFAALGTLVLASPLPLSEFETELHRHKTSPGQPEKGRVFHSAYKPLWDAHRRGQQLETLKNVTYDNDDYTLSSDFEITDIPTERNYYFDVSEVTAAPDGVRRKMFLVNARVNGELIEANEGDTIKLHVRNWLRVGTGIHFHGIPQAHVNYFDGPVGVVTCPIASKSEFTFSFKLENVCGTYLWHAHRGAQIGDGLKGPVVVHCPNDALKKGADFDREQVVMVTDNYHELSSVIMDKLRSPAGVYGSTSAPTPKSGLIQGRGDFDCKNKTNILKGHSCKKQSIYSEIAVPAGSLTRLRFINAGMHVFWRISVDEHEMKLIEVDDTAIDAVSMPRIPINAGQRFSSVLDTRSDKAGSSFWMRSFAATQCFRGPLNGFNPETLAIVRVVDPTIDCSSTSSSSGKQILPTSTPFPHDLVELCEDPATSILRPRVAKNTPDTADQVDYFNVTYMLAAEGGRFYMDGISFEAYAYDPLLFRAIRGESIANRSSMVIMSETTGEGGRARVHDIIVNNPGGGSHPSHLHGPQAYIVAGGTGTISKETWATMTPMTQNPTRRDVFTVAPNSYIVIRIVADLVGVHAFHCHFSPHTSVGMAGALVVRPDLIRQIQLPQESIDMCKASHYDPGFSEETPESARRR